MKEFRAGSVRASIWRDEVPGQGDEPFEVFSVRVEKRFKDAQGVWQSTNRFKRRELEADTWKTPAPRSAGDTPQEKGYTQ
ncbi:MAG: hypothetical protein WBD75_02340 [Phycisphaerae bacterium]